MSDKITRVWSLDTEDDSKGNIYLINFYDVEEDEHHTFKNADEAILFLCGQGSRIQIWATNLGYDLTNLFGKHLSALEITYIESRVISAKIVGTQVFFRDTLNHWKMSVAEMGKRIGLEKIESKGDFNNVKYCQRDTEITGKFVATQLRHYKGIGCQAKATIGSTALEFFQSNFSRRDTKRIFTKEEIQYLLRGYYGGRTEIFNTSPIVGNIQYFDFNSLYPSVMSENFFPTLKHKKVKKPDLKKEGICECTISSPDKLYVPYLPYRCVDTNALLFPLGTFRGHWTYFEIREAQKIGYKVIKFHSAIEFEGHFKPFQAFVETLHNQRNEAKEIKDDLLADNFKNLMNNLYGKFAQGNEITKLIPYQKSKLKHGDLIFGDMVLRKTKGEYPKHTNVVWAAYTTAYGRHKLWLAMTRVHEEKALLIYCDTDSVIFKSKKKIFDDDARTLGALKSEGVFKYAHFKLPKLYRLDNKYKAKGIPKAEAENYFEKGRASFKRPYKLKEALRKAYYVDRAKEKNLKTKAKRIIPNYWELTEKETSKKYDKRITSSSGETTPRTIKL